MEINTNVVSDALKTAANVTEFLNKRTEKEKEDAALEATDNSYTNTNTQPQHQVVQVQLGDPNAPKTPVVPPVVKKKKETHIHREFPEDRAMTDAECSLALEKAKMEHELKVKEMEYRKAKEEQDRKDRLEREARMREERERHEKERKEQEERENKFLGKVFKWLCGSAVCASVIGGAVELYKFWKKGKTPAASSVTSVTPVRVVIPSGMAEETSEADEK